MEMNFEAIIPPFKEPYGKCRFMDFSAGGPARGRIKKSDFSKRRALPYNFGNREHYQIVPGRLGFFLFKERRYAK